MNRRLAALRGRFRLPRRLRVTAEGKWFLVLTFGVGAAAINTGNNLLYIAFSMNLSLIILSGILSEWSLRRVSVQLRHASEAYASRDSLLAVTCQASGKRFPAMSLSVSLGLPGGPRAARFPDIPAGRAATRVVSFRPARRGPLPAFRCAVSTQFPFALFEKSADVVTAGRLIVYPEPADAGDAPEARASRDPADGAAPAGRHGASIRGARPHMPADPVRDIHWKASARLGKWMVKEREGESAPVAELRLPLHAAPAAFERLVSEACASVLRCEREGRPYCLWQGERLRVDAQAGSRRAQALSFLAVAEAEEPRAPRPREGEAP